MMKGRTSNRGAASRSGLTLIEVMVSIFLVSLAATIIYTQMILSYRVLMRSRARLEAQSIAFDHLWELYNTPLADMPMLSGLVTNFPTPAWSVMSTDGTVELFVEADDLLDPSYWTIVAQVWAPTNTPVSVGTNALARYEVWRYRGER